MFLVFVFALLVQNSVQELNSIDSGTVKDDKSPGFNVIYFDGPLPSAEQIRSVREILKTDAVETSSLANINPLVRYLVAPNFKIDEQGVEMNQGLPPHSHNRVFRRRRNASPTYKKSYPSSGGGGCCNQCGQCGGGGGGGGHSGSYSQSTSYSSSSSGSYSSNGKKK